VYQAVEEICGGPLDELDPEVSIGELPARNQAQVTRRIEAYQALRRAHRSRVNVRLVMRLLAAKWVKSALLGSTARHSGWDPRTMGARSVRGVVNERVKHTGDCSCVEERGRPTRG